MCHSERSAAESRNPSASSPLCSVTLSRFTRPKGPPSERVLVPTYTAVLRRSRSCDGPFGARRRAPGHRACPERSRGVPGEKLMAAFSSLRFLLACLPSSLLTGGVPATLFLEVYENRAL